MLPAFVRICRPACPRKVMRTPASLHSRVNIWQTAAYAAHLAGCGCNPQSASNITTRPRRIRLSAENAALRDLQAHLREQGWPPVAPWRGGFVGGGCAQYRGVVEA